MTDSDTTLIQEFDRCVRGERGSPIGGLTLRTGLSRSVIVITEFKVCLEFAGAAHPVRQCDTAAGRTTGAPDTGCPELTQSPCYRRR